jgi:disulfide oxidoreductase YuzD
MILDKLAKNIVANVGTVIWPLYRIFKERLELIKFEDIKIIHGTHNEFKATVRSDIEKNGLLCPLVVDKDLNLRNGNHRFKVIKKHGDASIFYKAQTDEEVNFLSRVNVAVWEMHPEVNDLSFCFEGKMKKYTEKCLHLFDSNVRIIKR